VKVYLDTNVLISAIVARGLCADLFRYLLAEHEVLTGEVNLRELRRVLPMRFGVPTTTVDRFDALLRDQTIIPKPAAPAGICSSDPDDDWVLASAIAAEADLLVTGDTDLLAVAVRSPVPIATPRNAWEQLRGR
jgi:putative PIN family toxin of toxin-antitoxin system